VTASEPAPFDISPLSIPGFRRYWVSRFIVVFSIQVISVAIGWQVYDVTRDPFLLGLVGLVQFLPALTLVLVTGSVADRYNRRRIIAACMAAEAACALLLLWWTVSGSTDIRFVFALLLVFGTARAFMGPSMQSLPANLVPIEVLPRAIAVNSSAFQVATISGPAVGGSLYGLAPHAAYAVAAVMLVTGAVLALMIPKPREKTVAEPISRDGVLAGFRFIWRNPVVLGAMSLDLFAVLLGGVTALLPAIARDVLEVGPSGLGALRAASGLGALSVSLLLVRRQITDHAGWIMFAAVAVYGIATIAFGMANEVWVAGLALIVIGASDMLSVYIRATLIQLSTPDDVRGRVNAANMTFIGASNELGQFRAGTMGALIGVVPAVIVGGVGALVVTAIWMWRFPALREARRIDGH
jgi:MFS family permease